MARGAEGGSGVPWPGVRRQGGGFMAMQWWSAEAGRWGENKGVVFFVTVVRSGGGHGNVMVVQSQNGGVKIKVWYFFVTVVRRRVVVDSW